MDSSVALAFAEVAHGAEAGLAEREGNRIAGTADAHPQRAHQAHGTPAASVAGVYSFMGLAIFARDALTQLKCPGVSLGQLQLLRSIRQRVLVAVRAIEEQHALVLAD